MTKENQTIAETEEREQPAGKRDGGSEGAGRDRSGPTEQPAEPSAEAVQTSPEDQRAGAGQAKSTDELERSLEEARAKADEHWNALLRAQADLENLRKRSAREVENAHKYGLDRFVSELLPVKDSLELGEAAADDDADVVKVREGIQLTLKMFKSALEKLGVEEIDPKGLKFDPEYHEAMSMQEVESAESGAVLTVVQKGYVLNGRLIRPAMVIVAK